MKVNFYVQPYGPADKNIIINATLDDGITEYNVSLKLDYDDVDHEKVEKLATIIEKIVLVYYERYVYVDLKDNIIK